MMTVDRFQMPFIACLFLALLITGCSSPGGTEPMRKSGAFLDEPARSARPARSAKFTGSRIFPVPPEIQDNVAFWRNVYGKWSRAQVAIHDDEHMGVIYEVAKLPGFGASPGYTAEQKRFVRARKAYYKERLANLAARVRSGLPPSRQERALYDKLVDAGGKGAIYGAADRVRSQRGLRERFRRGVEISGRYDDKFREIFRSQGLPEDLAYLPHVESSFQAHARSSAGAAGMWQFTRGTGKRYMTIDRAIDERLDPVNAAEGAAHYLRTAYRKLGSWPLAVTSYNHGQGGMEKAKSIYGNDIGAIVRRYKGPYFKFASRNFYAEFLAAREVASHPRRYFPEGISYRKPLTEDRLVLRYSMSAPRIARHYGVSTRQLAQLNIHWKDSAQRGRVNLPAGSTVWLPDGALSRMTKMPSPTSPMSAMVAKAEPKARRQEPFRVAKAETRPKPVRVAKAKTKPKPVKIAKAKAKPKPVKVAKARTKQKPAKVAKAKAKPKPVKVAKARTKQKPAKVAKAKTKQKPAKVAKAKTKQKSAKVAKAKTKQKSAKVAKAKTKQKSAKVAKAKTKQKAAKVAKAKTKQKPAKAASSKTAKVHVVKPQETLYRVSTYYKVSVPELRRLNRMGPEETTIRPGQKLRVSG